MAMMRRITEINGDNCGRNYDYRRRDSIDYSTNKWRTSSL